MDISNVIKICKVCGDRASCFNFNGLTCESCKSFFRRNALKYEKYSCLKSGFCSMDPISRKCCTRCRLDKCFFIGMKRELIYSKLEKVSSSKAKQSQKELKAKAISQQVLPSITSNCDIQLDGIIREKISTDVVANSITIEETSSLQLATFQPRLTFGLELSEHELTIIREINNAADEASFYDKTKFPVTGDVPSLIYALNLAELYIKKMIKMCKNISAFKCLAQDDQLVILKKYFTEMIIVCFSFTFMPEKDGFPITKDDTLKQALFIKLNILHEAKKDNFVFFCRQNLIAFHELLEEDTTIRDLILAKQLFRPRGINLNNMEFLRYQHVIYERLLNRYLEHKYRDNSKAVEKVNQIMEVLSRIDQFRDILEGIFLDVDSNQLTLLIHEIYNIR